jgi:hypothetical protein
MPVEGQHVSAELTTILEATSTGEATRWLSPSGSAMDFPEPPSLRSDYMKCFARNS